MDNTEYTCGIQQPPGYSLSSAGTVYQFAQNGTPVRSLLEGNINGNENLSFEFVKAAIPSTRIEGFDGSVVLFMIELKFPDVIKTSEREDSRNRRSIKANNPRIRIYTLQYFREPTHDTTRADKTSKRTTMFSNTQSDGGYRG